MINKTDTVVVDDCEFVHGFNDRFEYYSYTDENGWDWGIWRHRKGPINTKTWFASVSIPGRNGGVKMLNTAVVDGEGKVYQADPLYHLNPYSSQTLLEGLIPFIKAGKWPEVELCPKN
jgi:hypothetical protein